MSTDPTEVIVEMRPWSRDRDISFRGKRARPTATMRRGDMLVAIRMVASLQSDPDISTSTHYVCVRDDGRSRITTITFGLSLH